MGGVIKRVVKPKTRRGKRALVNREPKLLENTKQCLLMRGVKASQTVLNCVKDFTKLKKPHGQFFSRKHDYRPFEAVNEIEKMCNKYDSSLFTFASSNKKRPNNLVIGRLFDGSVLDMMELGIENFKGLDEFKNAKVGVGCKPCLLFSGEAFQTPTSDFHRLKNLLIDFFRGEEITNIRLEGIEHVLQFVNVDNKVFMRSYRIILKKSGEKTPYVELEEIGPSVNFVLRRTKLASADLLKSACRKPKELKPKKVKNISKDVFGSKMGRVHMPKQNMNSINIRNMKGLKKTVAERKLDKAKRVATKRNQSNNGDNSNGRPAGRSQGGGGGGRGRGPKGGPISRDSFNTPTGHQGGPWSAGAGASSSNDSVLSKLNTSRPSLRLNVSS